MEEKKRNDDPVNSTGQIDESKNTTEATGGSGDYIDATKQADTAGASEQAPETDVTQTAQTNAPVESTLDMETNDANTNNTSKIKTYAIATLVILVIAIGLLFALEKGGSVNTGLFAGVISGMEQNKPAATVNGEEIPMSDLNSGVEQLEEIASLQGADTESEEIKAQFRNQALETLINGELLRQTAVKEGIEVDQEEVDSRYNEISEGVGGDEILAERMAEFGINEDTLRRDIENEILIQQLFDSEFSETQSEVTEEEVTTFYEQSGGQEAGLPPLEEVREQIVQQIQSDKENQRINSYVQELRGEADIEILI